MSSGVRPHQPIAQHSEYSNMPLGDLFSWKRPDVGTWDALRCPKCSTVYRVGEDSNIASWEQVMELTNPGLSGFYGKIGFRNTRAGQHDSIKTMPQWQTPDDRGRATETLRLVRDAVEGGASCRWTCANCQYSGIRYPRKQHSA